MANQVPKYTIPSLENILAGKYVNTSPVSKATTT